MQKEIKQLDAELWVPIKGYENSYLISNYGKVKSLKRTVVRGKINQILPEIILKPQSNSRYLFNYLSNLGKKKIFTIHRLVAIHFIELINGKDQVNHIDGNRLNNHYLNLEWCTAKENYNHAIASGLVNRITNIEKVEEAIYLLSNGSSKYEIADRLGINYRTLCAFLKKIKDAKDGF